MCFSSSVSAQTQDQQEKNHSPEIHGILRGKYEYEPNLDASRFEIRNARLSLEGSLDLRSAYKMEVDLCDESSIKMKDAWVRLIPWKNSRITIGQQRMPFSIDAHRNPSAQYFANRSFIAKQVGDMRDVGAAVGYDFYSNEANRKIFSIDAGVYNGSNLDNQKTAWFKSPAYSARLQFFPFRNLAIIPSVQHQIIASRESSYTSLDLGAYYDWKGLHLESEYLVKTYANNDFDRCKAVNSMVIYTQNIDKDNSYLQSIGYLLRYDFMQDHSDGKKGFNGETHKLHLSDYERQRITAGLTFSVRNTLFPTDIRLNYEKYIYRQESFPKESEMDKIVVELMIRF